MINAELSYNPYLMETNIRFNGQPPRINSLVEKYQNMSLQSWISRIPKIFYDEMNGYYFGEFAIIYKRVIHGRPGVGATFNNIVKAEKELLFILVL